MAKTASLTAGLVAKKGQAAPAVAATIDQAIPATATPEQAPAPVKRIAMTVKLDPVQYEALKIFAVKSRTNAQEVFITALERYLKDAGHAA